MPGAAAGRSPLSTSRAPRPERTAAGAPAKSQAKRMALVSRLWGHDRYTVIHLRGACILLEITITGGHLHAPPSREDGGRTHNVYCGPAPCSGSLLRRL